jgi:hypothetical protein
MSSLGYLRTRSDDFEAEYEDAIQRFIKSESATADLYTIRRNWLNFKQTESAVDSRLYERKMKYFEKTVELNRLKLELDDLRLQGYYEAQQLKQLIAATKPRDNEDVTGKNRSDELERLRRTGMDEVKRALSESIHFREKLIGECTDLHTLITTAMLEEQQKDGSNATNLHNSLENFNKNLNLKLSISEGTLKKVTGEYLVLRHNSKIAQEVLTRSKNEYARIRSDLKDNFKVLEKSYVDRIAEKEQVLHVDLETRLRSIRDEVMRSDAEVENKYNVNDQIRHENSNKLRELKNIIREYNYKYKNLQERRKNELTVVRGELSRLSQILSEAEDNILKSIALGLHSSNQTQDEHENRMFLNYQMDKSKHNGHDNKTLQRISNQRMLTILQNKLQELNKIVNQQENEDY